MNKISFENLDKLPQMAGSEQVIIKLNTPEHLIDLVHRYVKKNSHPNCSSWNNIKDLEKTFYNAIKYYGYEDAMYVKYKHKGLFYGYYGSDFKTEMPIYEYTYSDYEVDLI